MKVTLAGFNVENHPEGGRSPEVLSAAYARVSRSPLTLDRLREQARTNVEQARRSNENIVFGMGHASIAEHAFFNIDIEDISRLALEELEKHRMASYTEKSQRYVKLDEDWHLPEEWSEHAPALQKLHREAVELYRDLMDAGVPSEDARYYLPLSVTGQVGFSCNARTAEHVILRLAASPFAEARALSEQLFRTLIPVVPSLIRYVEPTDWCRREEQGSWQTPVSTGFEGENVFFEGIPVGFLQLCLSPGDIDFYVLAHHRLRSSGCSFVTAIRSLDELDAAAREREFSAMLSGLRVHDPAPRCFEHVTLHWDWVLSAAAYAQLKRHRLAGVTCAAYDPGLGFTRPPTLPEAFVPRAERLRELSESTARLLNGPPCNYAYLSGHRRRLFWSANLREIVHFSRLREDAHAQWDIRAFATKLSAKVRSKAPLCGRILGGKDAFSNGLVMP